MRPIGRSKQSVKTAPWTIKALSTGAHAVEEWFTRELGNELAGAIPATQASLPFFSVNATKPVLVLSVNSRHRSCGFQLSSPKARSQWSHAELSRREQGSIEVHLCVSKCCGSGIGS